MATRNILDSIGNVIGTLTLDDNTTEDQWTSALAPYAVADPTIPSQTLITETTLTATDSVTTSSSTPTTVNGMICTPEKGKYIVLFNGSVSTAGASASGKFGIYIDGVAVNETLRPISCNLQLLGGLVTVSLNQIGIGTYTSSEITVDGTQTIDIRFFSTNGGTIGFNERTMTLIKVQ